jgi:dTMP kinase
MARAKLITIEGLDGAGTTTQARRLVHSMASVGLSAHQTSEPSAGPIGNLLRQILARRTRAIDPRAVALLFASDRVDHVAAEIQPRLDSGTHVVSDRYVYSSLAYQGVDSELEWVAGINARAPEPDLTVYLRVTPAVAAARRAQRGAGDELYDDDSTQSRICEIYDQLFGTSETGGSWCLEPAGSGWIQQVPEESPPGLARVARQPTWAVLDGTRSADELHLLVTSLVHQVCAVGEKLEG